MQNAHSSHLSALPPPHSQPHTAFPTRPLFRKIGGEHATEEDIAGANPADVEAAFGEFVRETDRGGRAPLTVIYPPEVDAFTIPIAGATAARLLALPPTPVMGAPDLPGGPSVYAGAVNPAMDLHRREFGHGQFDYFQLVAELQEALAKELGGPGYAPANLGVLKTAGWQMMALLGARDVELPEVPIFAFESLLAKPYAPKRVYPTSSPTAMSLSQSQSQPQTHKTFLMVIDTIAPDQDGFDARVAVPVASLKAAPVAGHIARTHGFIVDPEDVRFGDAEGRPAPASEASHVHLPKQYANPFTVAWVRREVRRHLIEHEKVFGAKRASEAYRGFLAAEAAKTSEAAE